MSNGDTGVWKWIATTLGGALIGAFLVMLMSASQVQALANHVQAPHPVTEARMNAIDSDIDDLKVMLREAINKMDRYHQARQ